METHVKAMKRRREILIVFVTKCFQSSVKHCGHYRRDGHTRSGVYKLFLPKIGEFPAYCIMDDRYGWTVMQRLIVL